MDVVQLKQQAAEKAVEFVQSGMVVGLGEGSTAIFAIRLIAKLLKQGALENIQGVPCSRRVEALAHELGIPLISLDDCAVIDVTIDGADEVDAEYTLIKGGGGALLREKMVAQATRREIIVVDETKMSDRIGTKWPVPIEVLEFGWKTQMRFLEGLGGKPVLRLKTDGKPYYTDEQNMILDTDFGPIADPASLAARLKTRAGIVEHGLFVGLATDVIVARGDGIVHLVRPA